MTIQVRLDFSVSTLENVQRFGVALGNEAIELMRNSDGAHIRQALRMSRPDWFLMVYAKNNFQVSALDILCKYSLFPERPLVFVPPDTEGCHRHIATIGDYVFQMIKVGDLPALARTPGAWPWMPTN